MADSRSLLRGRGARPVRSRITRFSRPPAIDLFAGCGGTSLGLQAAGFDIRAAVELDKAAAESYQLNIGLRPIVDDIKHVSGKQLLRSARLRSGECFLLAACPPCQGFSSQRRRGEGDRDPRNMLMLEVVRIVRSVCPAYILFENVPGLAEGRGKVLYSEMLCQLGRLGYHYSDQVVDAADFGVPQRRTRLIALFSHCSMPIVGIGAATHVDPKRSAQDRGSKDPWHTVIESIGQMPAISAGRTEGSDSMHAAPSHTPKTIERIRAIPLDGGSRTALPSDLTLKCHRNHAGHYDVYGRMWWRRPAPTITGGCNKPSKGRFIHPDQDRAITLREAALLQSFPESARFQGTRDKIAEQIGNAVPPELVRVLATPVQQIHAQGKRLRPRHLPVGRQSATLRKSRSLPDGSRPSVESGLVMRANCSDGA